MSWNQLLAILQTSRREIRQAKAQQPRACPNDGELLRAGPNNVLFCPFDGWQWPRDKGTAIT